MFIDFESATDVPFAPDICVVGAGIAGLTLVSALRQKGWKVLVLEGGGLIDEPRSESLFETEIDFAGAVNIGVANGRFSRVRRRWDALGRHADSAVGAGAVGYARPSRLAHRLCHACTLFRPARH